MLHAPLAVLPLDSAPFQRLADFDGDGDLDVIGTRIHENGGNAEIVVWRNDQGALTQAWLSSVSPGGISPLSRRSFAVDTADFNGDGRADFVVAAGAGVMVGIAQPNLTFQLTTYTLPLFVSAKAVATGDYDGDGVPDFAVAYMNDSSSNGALQVKVTGGGTITLPLTASFGAPLRLSALELDGGPRRELLLSDRNSATARIYGVAGGQLVLQQTLVTQLNYQGSTPWLWMGGDLDGDGDIDLVVFKPELGANVVAHYQVFRRTGPTTLVAEPLAIGGPAEYLADIDGDGDLDGVCCGGGGGPNYQWPQLNFESTLELSPNNGNGAFATAWAVPCAGSESLAGAADLDGDGDVDFVAGRCVFYGRGPWTEPPMQVAGGANALVTARPWLIHDVDRDGDPDLMTHRNRGDGDMTAAAEAEPAPPPGFQFTAIIEVDVDGDGAKDHVQRLVSFAPPQPAQFQYMVLLENNGGGHFHYAGQCGPTGMQIGDQYAYTVDHYLAADCDGDGDEDIIANSNPEYDGSNFSQIFWNNGGWFTPGPIFDIFSGGRIDRVADFDGDGLPDLLMSGNVTGLHVRRGTGNGTFATTWSAPGVLFEPAALALGDVNDDGRLDFVAPNNLGNPVLFVNTTVPGAGPTFAAYPILGVSIVLQSIRRSTITVGDFDGDGRTDLALGRIPGEPNLGIVLRRTSWSTPPTLANYDVVRQAFGDGFAVDADGDGDLDLVGERTTKGVRFHGPAAGSCLQQFAGVAGEDGATPVLGATGPFRVGHTEVFRLTGVPGPTLAILGTSLGTTTLTNVPLPGLTLRLDPQFLIVGDWPIVTDGDHRAAAMTTLPIYLPNGLQGFTFYVQAFVLDAAAPQFVSQTNLMRQRIGF